MGLALGAAFGLVLLLSATAEAQSSSDRALLAKLGKPSSDHMAQLVARSFFTALMRGNVEALLPLCDERVSLDGRWISGEERLRPALEALVERARLSSLKLLKLHLLRPQQMSEYFGPPPDRMKDAVGRRDLLALARFNRQGAVAVLTKKGRFWRVKALTD